MHDGQGYIKALFLLIDYFSSKVYLRKEMLENMRKEACVTKLSEFHSGSVLLDSYFMHYSFILILKSVLKTSLSPVSLCVAFYANVMEMNFPFLVLFSISRLDLICLSM